ncbi:hypothetical protein ACHWQZ_G008241 [Mnemiopsis leidyi]
MLFLSALLLLPPQATPDYCYPQYCYNYDGTYIWCDQSSYLCTPGSWYWNPATCSYVGEYGADHDAAIWCAEEESCGTDWVTGEPSCVDWGAAIKSGLSAIYIVVICVGVGVVVAVVICIGCCVGCCKKGTRHQGRVVTQNVVHPGNLPTSGNPSSSGNPPTIGNVPTSGIVPTAHTALGNTGQTSTGYYNQFPAVQQAVPHHQYPPHYPPPPPPPPPQYSAPVPRDISYSSLQHNPQ